MSKITVFDKEANLYIPVLKAHDGKVCPYAIVSGRYTKLVTAYHSIRGDLLDAKAMISYVQNNPGVPPIVKTSMFKSFIIQYSKCFTQAKGRKVKVEAESVFREHDELLVIHKEVIQMRHNYIAHAGEGKYEYGAMVIYLTPDIETPSIERIFYSDLKFMDHSLEIPGYFRICECVLEYLDSKLEKLAPFFDQELNGIEINELYIRSKTPNRKDWCRMYDADMLNAHYPAHRKDEKMKSKK